MALLELALGTEARHCPSGGPVSSSIKEKPGLDSSRVPCSSRLLRPQQQRWDVLSSSGLNLDERSLPSVPGTPCGTSPSTATASSRPTCPTRGWCATPTWTTSSPTGGRCLGWVGPGV